MDLNKKFPEKRVVITGAGSGLGRALALEFARRNWRIAIAEINDERAAESAKMVREQGGIPLTIHCDVTLPRDMENVLTIVRREWKGVDILINNAGVASAGWFERIPLEKWDWIIGINLMSIIYGCRTFIRYFKESGTGGYIVNVASSAGIASLPEMVSYNTTKAAVISLSETLRIELSKINVGVSVVCPTFFKTNLMDQFSSPDERQRQLADTFFGNAKITSEQVARHTVASIEKNRFYVITQADGRNMWRMKRWFPELYFKIFGVIYKKGIFDRHLGKLLRVANLFQ
ncbi:MAG TPA: SDR family oxidoreductase [Smithella sp.]|jgi:NAD(P)-dependent dehydrogenase (short-subunit alcohol dehydrogenase family)|nr:SDR family oxidoreductase [Smithella sp.]NMC96112.1 SDR family oxidoreductase [Deltaproteobacteria bacterium]HOO36114.1 SDR family oxidoreductase [Smithella sp.]HOS14167.1 SDR family oxidoreductase [Smithella sp.]HPH55106.1 SDR family oxidoreductase [Smithella sp.]